MNAVLLRPVIESDLEIFFEQQLDPQANQMAAFPARAKEPFITHWRRNLNNPTGTHRTILFNEQVAGNIMAYEQDDHTEIGYWLGRDYWGKGIATAALTDFLTIVTKRPLYAHVAKHNIASIRVLEKCGFTLFGEDTVPGEAIEEYILILRADD